MLAALAATGVTMTMSKRAAQWREVLPGVFLFDDACNVYCIKSGRAGLLIESGTGAVTNALRAIGVQRVAWVLHTHAHRDMTGGDATLAAAGAQIAVPDGTRHLFDQAAQGWYDRELLNAFDYGDKYFMPLRDTPVHHVLTNGETFVWKDVKLRVLASPGHTAQHVSFILERDGRNYIFCGDAISAPGKVWELDALQSTYEEFIQGPPALKRVPELQASLSRLKEEQPALLLPAHGKPFPGCAAGIDALQHNLSNMMSVLNAVQYFGAAGVAVPGVEALQTCGISYLLRGKTGRGILVDPSVDRAPDGRLFSDWLTNQMGAQRVEAVIITHYHADHLAMAPAVLNKYGAQLYAHDVLRDILQEPLRFHRPCIFPQGMRVTRAFADGERFEIDGIPLTFYHFPGHTYWHQAVLTEVNGKRVLFTGDAIDDFTHVRSIDCFNYNPIGARVGAMRCVDVLERTQPDFIATGHWGMHAWKSDYIKPMRAWVCARNAALTQLIAQQEPNLGYDMHWARLDPFRTVMTNATRVTLAARVYNHLPRAADVQVALTLPEGWRAAQSSAALALPPHAERSVTFQIAPARNAAATRHMIGLDVTLDGRRHGELGMAYVDIGADHSIEIRRPTFPMSELIKPTYGSF